MGVLTLSTDTKAVHALSNMNILLYRTFFYHLNTVADSRNTLQP